jgi:electron transfer flavoprotein beta subunit
MKIVCLAKQVPRGDAIEFDEETKSLRREGVPLELNLLDAYAVAHAVRLRDAVGGEVVAMTMGPPQAEEALRLALALGADRCVHLSDRVFALADTIGTSRTLALAIEKEGADLVLCGRKTLDSETWQVPAEVAAFLDWPQVTSVTNLVRARPSRRLLDRAPAGEAVGASATRLLGRREDHRLDGGRPGGGRPAERQALRPDRLSDACARSP